MTLNDPVPGLRRLWLNAVSPAKVSLSIAPGEVLEVSENVAAQLIAGDPHFKDVAPTSVAPASAEEPEAEAPKSKKSKG